MLCCADGNTPHLHMLTGFAVLMATFQLRMFK